MFQYGARKQRKRGRMFWFGLSILVLYLVFTIFAAYKLIKTTEISETFGKNRKEVEENVDEPKEPYQYKLENGFPTKIQEVEVWGKAAIGLYFWEHIMQGKLHKTSGELVRYGVKTTGSIRFKFRTGAGIVPQTIPGSTQHVVLIVNGRSTEKIKFAKMWLDSLRSLKKLKKAAVILLGSEQCNNNWLLPYMFKNGGLVNVAYVVYDITGQDDIFQWPLGVATYRNFPLINLNKIEISRTRAYRCNFLGTLYPNSSRETLRSIFNKHKLYSVCYLKIRETWRPSESEETADEYYNALVHSDLTLCPVGINTECYRIYEACSYGSVPVVEDVRTEGNCSNTPLKLLKYYNAPFVFIKSWDELPGVLEKEKQLSELERVRRRTKLLEWYREFKQKIQRAFVSKLKATFFK